MRRFLCGMLYCVLWYSSIVAGFLIIACPSLPLLLISPPKFRAWGDRLFSFWEIYATVLLNKFGVKIVVSGDHISPDDSAILVMNHRTRVDWNFFWAAMYQACMPSITAHKLKFILKDPIRHIPGPGWVMQMNGFVYITRHWEQDQRRLSRSLDYFIDLRKRMQFLIFPEGTDLTPTSKEKSDKYAAKKGLPKYIYTLHPKTTGFSYLTQHLQNANYLDAIYDITIAYPDHIPQSEVDLVKGKMPKEVHFLIKRIPAAEIPKEESNLRQWLQEVWVKKEKTLEQFSKNKSFSDERWPEANKIPLQVAFIFWTLLTCATVLLLIISPVFRLWSLIHAIFFIALSIIRINFNQLEIGWYWKWKSQDTSNKLK